MRRRLAIGFLVAVVGLAVGSVGMAYAVTDGEPDGGVTISMAPIVATIDIKPGSDPNSINCGNEDGVIAVAILTTEEYDATTVDHTTMTFEGAGEIHRDAAGSPIRHEEDVDDDGDMDLVFHFRLRDTDLDCESTAGTLSGETFAGLDIEGTDEVRMVSTMCRPSLRLPKEGAVLDNGRTDKQDEIVWDFAWSECRGAEAYNLYVIGPPPNVVYPLIDVYLPPTSSYHHACTAAYIADMNRLGWTWKVRAMVDGQWGEWSKVRTFDVEPVDTDPAQ